MVCAIVGPRYWLAVLAFGFGLATTCMSVVQSVGAVMAVRLVLGLCEAGMLPGIMLTFGHFYCRHELASRAGWQSGVTALSGAFGGLLAGGLSQIPAASGLHTWRWIFFVEGLLTIVMAICIYIWLPNSVAEATFLDEQEKRLASARLVEDRKDAGREPMSWHVVRKAIVHLPTQLSAVALISSLCCVNSIALFMVSRPSIVAESSC